MGWEEDDITLQLSSSLLGVADSNRTRRGRRTPHLKAGNQAKWCPWQAPRRFWLTERKNRINRNYGFEGWGQRGEKGTGELRRTLAPSQPHPSTRSSPNTTSCPGTSWGLLGSSTVCPRLEELLLPLKFCHRLAWHFTPLVLFYVTRVCLFFFIILDFKFRKGKMCVWTILFVMRPPPD